MSVTGFQMLFVIPMKWFDPSRKGNECLEIIEGGMLHGRILRRSCNGVCQVSLFDDRCKFLVSKHARDVDHVR